MEGEEGGEERAMKDEGRGEVKLGGEDEEEEEEEDFREEQ